MYLLSLLRCPVFSGSSFVQLELGLTCADVQDDGEKKEFVDRDMSRSKSSLVAFRHEKVKSGLFENGGRRHGEIILEGGDSAGIRKDGMQGRGL